MIGHGRIFPTILFLFGASVGAGAKWWTSGNSSKSSFSSHFSVRDSTGSSTTLQEFKKSSQEAKEKATPSSSALNESSLHDTPEIIAALDPLEQAPRLARWLATAKTEDMPAMGKALRYTEDICNMARGAFYMHWSEIDPLGARQFAQSSQEDYIYWWALAKSDPKAVEQALATSTMNRHAKGSAIRGIAQSDPERGKRLLELYPELVDNGTLEGLVSSLSKTDPVAAANMALKVWSSETQRGLKEWAEDEPEVALAWAAKLPASRKGEVLELFAQKWELSDPNRVAKLLAEMPPSASRTAIWQNHLEHLALTNPAAAEAGAREGQTPSERQRAYESLSLIMADHDASAALKMLVLADAEQSMGNNMPSPSALEKLGRKVPEQVMAYLDTLPENRLPAEAKRAAFSGWLVTDSMKASEWLTQQPLGETRRRCVHHLIDFLSNEEQPDFTAALHWAGTLEAQDRENSIESIMTQWHKTNAEAAVQALDAPTISAEMRERLSTHLSLITKLRERLSNRSSTKSQ